ncbi:TetR/AcrR family transcriptional regulator [Cryobacterium tepidiphilum]|jgi:AcrR family transcriptional regulator|nr:TetR/AcrR family transcriptional regulator [Cryobacterium tepidiphilum]
MSKPNARERILQTAYELFTQRGVRDVPVDEIIRRSGVAIATFYRHFRSKDELVTAFLSRREQLWTSDSVVSAARERGSDPVAKLLAIFDVFDEWFHRENFEGDSFVNVLIEMGANHPLGKASIGHLANVRKNLEELAIEAGLREPKEFAFSYQILMKGSIIEATMGDLNSAKRAQHMAASLIKDFQVADETGDAEGATA